MKRTSNGRIPLIESEPNVIDDFIECIEMGLSNAKACDYAGITEKTLYEYISRGEDDINAGKDTHYSNFLKRYKKSRSKFVRKNVSVLQNASKNGSWQASAWLLERRCPEDFAQHKEEANANDQVSINNDVPTQDEE